MPYAKAINDYVKGRGGLIYTHDCGRSATMIREGLYNELAPSCLETLAPLPAGDIDDLLYALGQNPRDSPVVRQPGVRSPKWKLVLFSRDRQRY